jgi:hypothetical protein
MAAVASRAGERANAYQRRRPETTALYEVVRDNLETLYGAIDDGAIAVRLPKHAKKELEAFLACGLLCRGFARTPCPIVRALVKQTPTLTMRTLKAARQCTRLMPDPRELSDRGSTTLRRSLESVRGATRVGRRVVPTAINRADLRFELAQANVRLN